MPADAIIRAYNIVTQRIACPSVAATQQFAGEATRFHKKRVNPPTVVEIFCGHAGIASACRRAGFHTVAIDWKANRHRARQVVSQLDLSTDADHQKLFALLQDTAVVFVWLGPPCGTFTRSREIPLPKWTSADSANCRPLRNGDFPTGLPGLQVAEQAKVIKDNILARVCADVCSWCLRNGVEFAIENPRSSWFWRHPFVGNVCADSSVILVQFQMCMFGASRDQWLQLATNVPALSSLARICDHSHEHTPWGAAFRKRWDVAVCECVARCVDSSTTDKGHSVVPTLLVKCQADRDHLAAVAKQHRAAPQRLVPEYRGRVLELSSRLDAATMFGRPHLC